MVLYVHGASLNGNSLLSNEKNNSPLAFLKNLLTFKNATRSEKTKKNIAILFPLHGLNFLFTLLVVPISLNYLGQTSFGVWLTISSMLLWLNYFDFGIGNGLKNKVCEALALNDIKLARVYVSTAYGIFFILFAAAAALFAVANLFLDWKIILNAPDYLMPQINNLMLPVFVFVALQVFLKLIYAVTSADQKVALNGFFSFLINLFSLAGIWLLSRASSGSIFLLGLISVAVPVVVLALCSVYLFKTHYKHIAPSFKYFNMKYSNGLVKTGLQFFIIQIAGLVVFATDNLIITQLLGPDEVTVYNIAYKLFVMFTQMFAVFMSPFWSAFTEAYAKKEFVWIKKAIKKAVFAWGALSVAVCAVVLSSDFIYKIWIGNKVTVPFILTAFMGLFAILSNWNNIFAAFINGVGKIRLQFYASIFIAIINIPLCVLFTKYLNMGVTGIIVATCVCVVFGSVGSPWQTIKIINGSDKGLWGK